MLVEYLLYIEYANSYKKYYWEMYKVLILKMNVFSVSKSVMETILEYQGSFFNNRLQKDSLVCYLIIVDFIIILDSVN